MPLPCEPGYYCPNLGMSKANMITYPCPAKKYCTTGMETDGTACVAGQYCPVGSTAPLRCPAGTFLEVAGEAPGDCKTCTAGSYCGTAGLSAVSGDCDPGYACGAGRKAKDPSTDLCQPGEYCRGGSHPATPCEANTYQDESGKSECK